MPVEVAVVVVVVVVIVVNGYVVVMMIVPEWVAAVVVSVPAPSVVETVVIPVRTVIVWAIVETWPPPIVSQVNAQTPTGWLSVIPVHIGEKWVVISPSSIYVGVEPAYAGSVIIVVIIVWVIGICRCVRRCCRCGSGVVNHFHVSGYNRFALTGIIGQGAEQIAVLIGFVYD